MKRIKDRLQAFNSKMNTILRMMKSDVYILYYASSNLQHNGYQTNIGSAHINICMSILYHMINNGGFVVYDNIYETIMLMYPNYKSIEMYIERHQRMVGLDSDLIEDMHKYYIEIEEYEKCSKLSDIIKFRNQIHNGK